MIALLFGQTDQIYKDFKTIYYSFGQSKKKKDNGKPPILFGGFQDLHIRFVYACFTMLSLAFNKHYAFFRSVLDYIYLL